MNLHTSPAAASPAPATVPSGRTPVARALGVSRMFGAGSSVVHAVEGVTVAFERGVLSAVIGPSGSGKTTLMHLLAGLDAPTVGDVELDGVPLGGLDDTAMAALRHERTGFVFQSFNLMPALTALENIRLPETLGRRVRQNDRVWEQQLVSRLGIAPLLDRRPGELSGGQQQRGRDRPGARAPPRRGLRRRAHGQPRHAHERRGARPALGARHRDRQRHRHGHPRSRRREPRRPGRRPPRRPHRSATRARRSAEQLASVMLGASATAGTTAAGTTTVGSTAVGR